MTDGYKLLLGAAVLLALGAAMVPQGGVIEVFGWHFTVAGCWWVVGLVAWALTPYVQASTPDLLGTQDASDS